MERADSEELLKAIAKVSTVLKEHGLGGVLVVADRERGHCAVMPPAWSNVRIGTQSGVVALASPEDMPLTQESVGQSVCVQKLLRSATAFFDEQMERLRDVLDEHGMTLRTDAIRAFDTTKVEVSLDEHNDPEDKSALCEKVDKLDAALKAAYAPHDAFGSAFVVLPTGGIVAFDVGPVERASRDDVMHLASVLAAHFVKLANAIDLDPRRLLEEVASERGQKLQREARAMGENLVAPETLN